jgi:hypothetical protein
LILSLGLLFLKFSNVNPYFLLLFYLLPYCSQHPCLHFHCFFLKYFFFTFLHFYTPDCSSVFFPDLPVMHFLLLSCKGVVSQGDLCNSLSWQLPLLYFLNSDQ